jgi:hypothetical protein
MTLRNGKDLTLKREHASCIGLQGLPSNYVTSTSVRDHPGDFRRLVGQCIARPHSPAFIPTQGRGLIA